MLRGTARQSAQGERAAGSSAGHTLLLVDDEPRVSRGLQRTLRQDGYTILIANGAKQALRILSERPVDVILSDQRMPGMKGTELLRAVSEAYPDTLRLILSGAADVEIIARAMDSGVIYKFLTKPIDPALLRANISEAFSRSAAMKVTQARQAAIDGDPGLPTRKGVEAVFKKLLDAKQPTRSKALAVLVLRVDQYDGIVSSYGGRVSEEVLRELSRRLARVLKHEEVLGRDTSGTYLMVLSSADPAARVAEVDEQIDRLLEAPVQVNERGLTITLSIGASVHERQANFDEFVDQAHTAMMTGKERGGATVQLFQPHLIEAFRGQLELESALRCAVAENAFELHYQPQVDVTSGRIIGLETLVRWQHPEYGFVSPGRFIPIAEQSGLIEALGMWVLRTAVEQFTAWDRAGKAPLELSVNVSARQLRKIRFANSVAEVLQEFGLRPERLVLEVTESAAIEENDAIARCLTALHGLGVTLAIDDFGTGYANLGNLTRFTFAQLKIDRSLLPESPQDKLRMSLYRKLFSLAKELRMVVVAEGVETASELAAVIASGGQIVQGYFYSAPVAASQLDQLLEKKDAKD